MKLIFEKSVAGRRCAILPACDVDPVELPEWLCPDRGTVPAGDERNRHFPSLQRAVPEGPRRKLRFLPPWLLHHEVQSPD